MTATMIRQNATTLILLWQAFQKASVSAETAFSFANGVQCNNGVSVSISEIQCGDNGASTCQMGETVDVSGQVTFSNAMPEKSNIDLKFCFLSLWPCKNYTFTSLDLCDWLSADNDSSSCPTQGTYNFDVSFELPDTGDGGFNYGSGKFLSTQCGNQNLMEPF